MLRDVELPIKLKLKHMERSAPNAKTYYVVPFIPKLFYKSTVISKQFSVGLREGSEEKMNWGGCS